MMRLQKKKKEKLWTAREELFNCTLLQMQENLQGLLTEE